MTFLAAANTDFLSLLYILAQVGSFDGFVVDMMGNLSHFAFRRLFQRFS
jgi:hypothetical protein